MGVVLYSLQGKIKVILHADYKEVFNEKFQTTSGVWVTWKLGNFSLWNLGKRISKVNHQIPWFHTTDLDFPNTPNFCNSIVFQYDK